MQWLSRECQRALYTPSLLPWPGGDGEEIVSESVLVKNKLWCCCFTLFSWWRRWAGKNDMILALIHDMQMLASDWLTALSVTVMLQIQFTDRQRKGERERDGERDTGLLVGFWLIE